MAIVEWAECLSGVATDYHKMVKWALSLALSGDVSQSVRSLSNTELDSQHTLIRKTLRVEAKQTRLTARACATHLMFALTHRSMPLTQMVHS